MAPKGGKSAGGSANEHGSLHRNGVAAFLAAQGLAGAPLDGFSGRVPLSLALETDDEIDDIVCLMENDERWLIQAKSSVNKNALRKTIEQWNKHALKESDTLVLATRALAGFLAGAARVLEARRLGRVAELPKSDVVHFETFEARVREICSDRTAEILERARIVAWQVETVVDPLAEAAASRLERLTSPGRGHIAYRTLQAFFQQQGAARTSTSAAHWLQALRDAELEIAPDGLGAKAARREAFHTALARYRRRAAMPLDRLDLSVISPRVPTVKIEDFLLDVEISYRRELARRKSDPLPHVLRRNSRLVICGLPGSGKSEAMRQATAWLAAADDAPIPVLVRLADLAPSITEVQDVTLERLIRTCVHFESENSSGVIVDALMEVISTGNCVLLFDGLDETFEKRGTVAAGLSQVIDGLDPRVGVIVTTRESAMDSAQSLQLPVVDLSPADSRRVQHELVRAYAAMTSNESDHEDWVDARTAALASLESTHSAIWQVPLLSTLACVRLLEGHSATDSTVDLLSDVILDSIERWESRRTGAAKRTPDSNFNTEMLLDGFAAIGRALNTDADVTVSEAEQLVLEALERWELPRPVSKRIAKFIVNFWDNEVGVFVATGASIRARSRVFAEMGDAYALLRLDSAEERIEWLEASLALPSKGNALALAASADLPIARWLIAASLTEAGVHRGQAVTWLAEFLPRWSHVTTEDIGSAMVALASAANDAVPLAISVPDAGIDHIFGGAKRSRDRSDGFGWAFAVELASLAIPAALEAKRNALLAAYATDQDRASLLQALSALTIRDPIPSPDSELLELTELALSYPLSEYQEEEPFRDRFGTMNFPSVNEPAIVGLDRLALRAAAISSQLSEAAVERLWNIARRLPSREYLEIRRALRANGHAEKSASSLASSWARRTQELQFSLDWFLPHFTQADVATTGVHNTDRWRMTALADAVETAGLRDSTYGDLVQASEHDGPTTRRLLLAAVLSAKLDASAISLAANDLLLLDKEPRETLVSYLHTPRLDRHTDRFGPIPEDLALDLVPLVGGVSRWESRLAREILRQQRIRAVRDAAATTTAATWSSEANLALVRIFNADTPIAEVHQLQTEASPGRWAAALYLLAGDTDTDPALLDRARVDEDGTVRDAAGAPLEDVLAAEFWTCTNCSTANAADVFICTRCDAASRDSMRTHERIQDYISRVEGRTAAD